MDKSNETHKIISKEQHSETIFWKGTLKSIKFLNMKQNGVLELLSCNNNDILADSLEQIMIFGENCLKIIFRM